LPHPEAKDFLPPCLHLGMDQHAPRLAPQEAHLHYQVRDTLLPFGEVSEDLRVTGRDPPMIYAVGYLGKEQYQEVEEKRAQQFFH
jgi:hypothetical protein